MWPCLVLMVLLGAASWAKAQGQIKVDLELILMVAGSGSVDDEEYLLQRLGYARALSNPRVPSAKPMANL